MKKLKHKFNAIRCEVDSIKFPSLLEKRCYIVLKKLREAGKILFFLQQIPFLLPGGKKHFVDFLVFTPSNTLFIESKGRDLAVGALKRGICENLANITIHVVKDPKELYPLIEKKS
jgi:hypothetical protein